MQLQNLPNETLVEIYLHLPLFEQLVVFPLVCKRWKAVAELQGRRERLSQLLFKKFADSWAFLYTREQRGIGFELAKRSRLFEKIKESKERLEVDFSKGSFPSTRATVAYGKAKHPVKLVRAYGQSSEFYLRWRGKSLSSPGCSLKLRQTGKAGDRRMRLSFNFERVVAWPEKAGGKNLFYLFNFTSASTFQKLERKGRFFWSEEHAYDLTAKEAGRCLEAAVSLSMERLLERTAELNTQLLLNLKELSKKLKRGVVFEVGPWGKIVQFKEKRSSSLQEASIRQIRTRRNKGAFLRWESELSSGDLLPFSRALSCVVLSRTVSKISEKLGLALKLS